MTFSRAKGMFAIMTISLNLLSLFRIKQKTYFHEVAGILQGFKMTKNIKNFDIHTSFCK